MSIDNLFKSFEVDVNKKLNARNFYIKTKLFDHSFFTSPKMSFFYDSLVKSFSLGAVIDNRFSSLVSGNKKILDYKKEIVLTEVSKYVVNRLLNIKSIRLNGQVRNFDLKDPVIDRLIDDYTHHINSLFSDKFINSNDDLFQATIAYFHSINPLKKRRIPDYNLKKDSLAYFFDDPLFSLVKNGNNKNLFGSGQQINGYDASSSDDFFIPKRNFSDVIGLDEQKKIMSITLMSAFKNKELYDKIKKNPDKIKDHFNFLFYGKPGTGKSYFAEAVAGELGIPVHVSYGPDFVKKMLGEGKDLLMDLYSRASRIAPAIIFIDEVDQVAQNRQSFESNLKHDLTESLFGLIYGSRADPNVITIMATNIPENIDSGVWSRVPLQNQLYFPPLSDESKKRILNYHLSNYHHEPLSDKELINLFNKASSNPRRLEQLIHFSSQIAASNNHNFITKSDIEESLRYYSRGDDK